MIDSEFVEDFLSEAEDLIISIESSFLKLEENPSDFNTLNEIFRFAHNIKGTSKSVGLNELSAFTHEMENILVELKEGREQATSKVVDLLLECSDRINSYVQQVRETGDYSLDFEEMKPRFANVFSDPADSDSKTADETTPYIHETLLQEHKPLAEKINEVSFVLDESIDFDVDEDAFNLLKDIGKVPEDLTYEQFLKCANYIEEKKGDHEKCNPVECEDDSVLKFNQPKPQTTAAPVKKEATEYIRIPVHKIDGLLDGFGEQVILQSLLSHIKYDLDKKKDSAIKTITQLGKITYDLEQTAISLRMISMKNIFQKMERIVRDTSKIVDKQVRLITEGADTELDKNIVAALGDPLTHMVRNAVDHGIENKIERVQSAKSIMATIRLKAYHKSGSVYIEISDDGGGISKQKVLDKAIKKGIVSANADLSDHEIRNLIFAPGFSTAEKTTEISGRGVGLDVVQSEITRLKGTVEVFSEEGKGTKFVIKLPISMAIFNGTIVQIGSEKYILPNSDIRESISEGVADFRVLDNGSSVIRYKEEVLPVLNIAGTLGTKLEKSKNRIYVITPYMNTHYAVLVDDIIEQQRIVRKSVGSELSHKPWIAGGTILGDGHVVLILEVSELISTHGVAA